MARKRKDEAAQDDIEEVEETVEEADDNSSLDTVEEAKDDSSLDTVEEADDNSSLDTVEEAKDDSSLDTVEEAKDDSSLDTVEEAEESASSDDEETPEIIEEVEEDHSSLLASLGVDLEFLHDGNNMSFYQANKAYYEDRNYEGAIAEFQAAIEYEKSQPSDLPDVEESEDSAELAEPPPNDVLVKSMYWMAEAYLKLNQVDQAVETFGQLSGHYSLHYLAPAAERRLASLKPDEESKFA